MKYNIKLAIILIALLIPLYVSAQNHTIRRSGTAPTHQKGKGNSQTDNNLQYQNLNLKGSFYNQKGSWPVEFVIRIKKDGQISGVYKNISQHVSMKVGGQLYSDGSMELYDLNGNLHVSLSKTDLGKYNGKASSGQTTLNVTLTEQ